MPVCAPRRGISCLPARLSRVAVCLQYEDVENACGYGLVLCRGNRGYVIVTEDLGRWPGILQQVGMRMGSFG